MAAQSGRLILVYLNTTGATWVAAAGLREKSISFNDEAIDITTADSSARWREVMDAEGIRSFEISGSGVFTDAAIDANFQAMFANSTIKGMRFLIPSFYQVEALCKFTTWDFNAPHDDALTYDMTFISAGAVTWTAV